MSKRTTFLSPMTMRSIILALRAVMSPFVLWRTLGCGLPADMVLQKRPRRFAKTNNPNVFLLGHKNLSIITVDFFTNIDRNYHIVVPKNNPNTADICIS
jgi:hypothetical protein